MKTAVRACTVGDLPAVAGLLAELAAHLGEEQPITTETIRAQFEAVAAVPGMYASFVYDRDGVKGYMAMVFYRSLFHRTGTALITELVVSEEHRGGGIGAALIRRAFAEANEREMEELEVGVLRENPRAAAFYRKNGFDEEYILLGHDLARK